MYEIKILTDLDFDQLPYKYAKEAYGLADPKTNRAYVRMTGNRRFDQGTLEHELDELMQKVSPHEEDGIRYKKFFKDIVLHPPIRDLISGDFKKFGKTLLTLASIIPSPIQPFAIAANIGFTGHDIATRGFQPTDILSLAGPALGALKGFTGATGSFANAIKGAVGLPSAAASAGTGGLKGALSATGGISPNISNFGGQARTFAPINLDTAFAATKSGAGGISGTLANLSKGGVSGTISNAARSGIYDKLFNVGQPQPSFTSNLQQGVRTAGRNLASNTIQNLITSGFGQSSQPSQAFATADAAGGLDLSQGALQRFGGEAYNQFQNYTGEDTNPIFNQERYDQGIGAIDANYRKRYRDIFDQFRGQSVEGNTAFQRSLANLERSTFAEKDAFTREADEANRQQVVKAKYNSLKRLNNLSDAKMREFIQLSQKGDDDIYQQTGMNPSEFKSIFEGLGAFA